MVLVRLGAGSTVGNVGRWVVALSAWSALAAAQEAPAARCIPTPCAVQGVTCGRIPDGCGGMLDCGACPPPAAREPIGFRLSLSLDWPLVRPGVEGERGASIAAGRLPLA